MSNGNGSNESNGGNGGASRYNYLNTGATLVGVAAIAAIFTNPIEDKITANDTKQSQALTTLNAKYDKALDELKKDLTKQLDDHDARLDKKNQTITALQSRLKAIETQGIDGRFREADFNREMKSRDYRINNNEMHIKQLDNDVRINRQDIIRCCSHSLSMDEGETLMGNQGQ